MGGRLAIAVKCQSWEVITSESIKLELDHAAGCCISPTRQIFDKTKILFFILLLFPICKKFFLDSCSMELFDCFEITILFAKHSSHASSSFDGPLEKKKNNNSLKINSQSKVTTWRVK